MLKMLLMILRSSNLKCSSYVDLLNEHICNPHSLRLKKFLNHEFRANGPKVRARFRLNQVLNKLDTTIASKLKSYIKYKENSKLDNELLDLLSEYWLLDVDGKQLKNGFTSTDKKFTSTSCELINIHNEHLLALDRHQQF